MSISNNSIDKFLTHKMSSEKYYNYIAIVGPAELAKSLIDQIQQNRKELVCIDIVMMSHNKKFFYKTCYSGDCSL